MRRPRSFPGSFVAALLAAAAVGSLADSASAETLRIRAWIDGRSNLRLRGDTAYWVQYEFAAPGRLDCDTGAPIEPTQLGSALWFPNWPDTPTCENRNCFCFSDVFTGVTPRLPEAHFSVSLHVLQGRGACWISEIPVSGGGWQVGIEFDDNPFGGADWYEVDLEFHSTWPGLTVSAQSDPFLAGQPPGTTTHQDVAPDQSPVLVPLFVPEGVVRVTDVSGTASFGPAHPFYGPEDGPPQASASDLGIAGFTMPLCSLLGVFLPDTTNSGLAPPALDFTTPESRDFLRLEPQLFQPFFIGDGVRADGITRQGFVIPAGATRLYLGICDGHGWFDNVGGFQCAVEQRPPGAPPCSEWSLAQDFLLAPDQQNPGRDRCSNADVWHYLQSDAATFPSRDPSTFTLLALHSTSMFGVDGIESWQGVETQPNGLPNLPNVAVNATGDHVSVLGVEWPPDALAVHPAATRHVVVGWRSPWTGLVSISGGLQDLDTSCATATDGVLWFLDHFDGVTSANVASGAIDDGGAQEFSQGAGGASLAALAVEEGDFLYLVVDRAGGLGCDTTGLELRVRPATSGSPFCFGDGLGALPTTACPCANFGAAGHGCGNSVNPDGARLVALGDVALDDVVLSASGMPSTVACIFLQGDGLTDALLNDGIRCVGGTLRRLRVRQNIQGTSCFPDENDVWTLSERGLVVPGSGAIRHYQAYYRNAAVSFCPSGVSNLTNGWTLVW